MDTQYLKRSQLKVDEKDYLERVAFPYYKALATWYSNIGIGVKGADFYTLIDKVLPQNKYKWTLNPGHYTADEEWLSSPFYPKFRGIYSEWYDASNGYYY